LAGRRHPVRTYDVNGKKLPSVTSIIGRTDALFNPSKEAGLEWWRSKEKDHRQIVEEACRRGSIIHSEIELALTGKQSTEYTMDEWNDFCICDYMTQLLPVVQEMGEDEVEVEKVVSHSVGYAGTADLVCHYKGKKTIVDWKTTRHSSKVGKKPKKRSHYKGAEVQIAAYGSAYNSDTRNTPVEQGAIVVVYDWREPDVILLDNDDLIMRSMEFQERFDVFQVLEG